MAERPDVVELLRQSWVAERAGVGYFDALAKRFAERAGALTTFRLVEQTTRNLIEPVARLHGVEPIDQEAAERGGARYADSQGDDWSSAVEAMRRDGPTGIAMFAQLAAALPEEEAALGVAVVEHEHALLQWFEREATGKRGDMAPVIKYLSRHGVRIDSIDAIAHDS